MATLAPPKPSHDELEALIKEARQRQLRRRLLGAAGVAIAAEHRNFAARRNSRHPRSSRQRREQRCSLWR
jgi:hypothetical protein